MSGGGVAATGRGLTDADAPAETPEENAAALLMEKGVEPAVARQLAAAYPHERVVDVVATNSAVNIVDVGNVQVGSFTIAVDTRRKMVDRARFFAETAETTTD